MGSVLRAIDPDFDRPLAVKIMLGTCDERRFLEEARITGRLQHPGIPPVHELGRLEDGRPFFSMKLIEGKTLAALLAERTAERAAADLLRFIGFFEQICQTLAYAHSRGVIHRDLKPANIMVGVFGEVQVMDWGLAKNIKKPETRDKREDGGDPSADSQPLTRQGDVMGTLPYTPPEQARGEIDQLDERSDVFGLGAILCVILTGEPPFYSKNRGDVIHMARRGDVTQAVLELDRCGADAELIALCKTCLSPHKADRLRDAGEVAEAVAAYQQGVQEKLQQAELDKAQAEIQVHEERKRRKVEQARADEEARRRQAEQDRALEERRRRRTMGLALALLAAAGVAVSWIITLRIERLLQRRDVTIALQEAETKIRAGAFSEASELFHQVEGRLGTAGPDDLRQGLEELQAGLQFAHTLEQIRLERSIMTKPGFNPGFNYNASLNRYYDAFANARLNLRGEI